jgi:hypothetical protein
MPLTEAEFAFIHRFSLEGFSDHFPTQPAWDSMVALGLIPNASGKVYSFQYLSQEQSKIENRPYVWDADTGELLRPPVVPCPWPDPEAFYRRWEAILPEIVAIDWERHHEAKILLHSSETNHSLDGPVTIQPFLCTESEFLVAFYAEIKSRHFGPCFRQVAQADIWHYDLLYLIERLRNEILRRGQDWPPPHPSDPICPWPDDDFFKNRFGPKLNPQIPCPTPNSPSLTPAEQIFLDHYHYEVFSNVMLGPVSQWFLDHKLNLRLIDPLSNWCWRNDPDFEQKVMAVHHLAPFVIPWSSPEEFLSRVEDFLSIYPELRDLVAPHIPSKPVPKPLCSPNPNSPDSEPVANRRPSSSNDGD